MWGSIFSSVFQFSWPRIDVDWMSCNVHFLGEFNFKLSIVIPFLTPSEALGVGTWRSIFFRVTFIMASDECGWDGLQCGF